MYDGFTTGSTLLNLAITNNKNIGYVPSKIYHFYGEPGTGKSYLATEGMFYALRYAQQRELNPKIYYVDMEGGFLDEFIAKIAPDLIDAIEEDQHVHLRTFDTFEEVFGTFEDELMNMTENDFLYYVIDSIDGLVTKEDMKTKLTDGTYGTQLAKKLSQTLRRYLPSIKKKNVVLILISQVREQIGAYRPVKTYSGGFMLKHGPHVSIFLSKNGIEYKKTKIGEIPVGINVSFEIKKNRLAEPFRKGTFRILFESGIDDVYSCLEYLKKAGLVESKGAWYKWNDITAQGIDRLAQHIIENNLVNDLRKQVEEIWNETLIQTKCGRPSSISLWGAE